MKRKSTKKTVFTVLILVVAMMFGMTAGTVTAIEPVGSYGTDIGISLEVGESLQAMIPEEFLTLINSLKLNVVQMHDESGETPVDFFRLDVAGTEGVALSVGALTEGDSLLIDVPVLFDSVLDVDVPALMTEVLAPDSGIGIGVPSLTDFNLDKLTMTMQGVVSVIEMHMPEVAATAPELFTIENLSAELTRSQYVFADQQLVAIVNDIVTFLETDEGALELYEKILVPLSDDEEVKSWPDMLNEFRSEAASGLTGLTISIDMLNDAEGEARGFVLTVTPPAQNLEPAETTVEAEGMELDMDSFETGPVQITALELESETGLEGVIRFVNQNDEMLRLFLGATAAEDGSLNGTFSMKLHEASDVASAATEYVLGEFSNVIPVPFGPGMMLAGSVSVVITYDEYQEPLTLTYMMTPTPEGRLSGQIGLQGLFNLNLDIGEMADVVIPADFTTKTKVPLSSMEDLELIFTDDSIARLMQVMVDLGIPLDSLMPTDEVE